MKFENLLIAHRGIHDNIDIPENTLQAFKKAIKKNISIELDVQLTKDNVLVVFHDDNLKRMTGINKNIKDITYNELKDIKLLNTNDTIPTFSEVLKVINGKVLLDIEIKDTKKIKIICNKIIKELETYNYQFIIKSFNPKIVRYINKNKKEYLCGLLLKDDFYNKLIGGLIIKYCKPNFLAISKKFIDKNGINKCLKKYPLLVWTILNKEEFNKYNDLTNNFICNNLPF